MTADPSDQSKPACAAERRKTDRRQQVSDTKTDQASELDPLKAIEEDWSQLARAKRTEVWKLVNLAVDLRPTVGMRTELKKGGEESKSKLVELDNLREVIDGALREDADNVQPLRYIPSEDGKEPKLFNRKVDVVVFVDFAEKTGCPIHERMTEVAEALRSIRRTDDSDAGEGTDTNTHEGPRNTKRNELVIGLLALYLGKLAIEKRPPPPSINHAGGEKIGTVNFSGLTNAIHNSKVMKWRNDIDHETSGSASGIRERNIRDAISQGLDEAIQHFEPVVWKEGKAAEQPPIAK